MSENAESVAVALAELRGAVSAGFAKLDGRLDVSLQRLDTAEREIRDLKAKAAALEAKIWRFSMAAAAVGTGGTGFWQLVQ